MYDLLAWGAVISFFATIFLYIGSIAVDSMKYAMVVAFIICVCCIIVGIPNAYNHKSTDYNEFTAKAHMVFVQNDKHDMGSCPAKAYMVSSECSTVG